MRETPERRQRQPGDPPERAIEILLAPVPDLERSRLDVAVAHVLDCCLPGAGRIQPVQQQSGSLQQPLLGQTRDGALSRGCLEGDDHALAPVPQPELHAGLVRPRLVDLGAAQHQAPAGESDLVRLRGSEYDRELRGVLDAPDAGRARARRWDLADRAGDLQRAGPGDEPNRSAGPAAGALVRRQRHRFAGGPSDHVWTERSIGRFWQLYPAAPAADDDRRRGTNDHRHLPSRRPGVDCHQCETRDDDVGLRCERLSPQRDWPGGGSHHDVHRRSPTTGMAASGRRPTPMGTS